MQGTREAARFSRWLPLALMPASLVPVTGAYAFLPADSFGALFSEAGSVEAVTALLYGVLLVVLLVWRSRIGLGLMPFFLVALMLAREWDLDRRFTPRTIFALRFYTDPEISLALKIAVFAAVAALAAAILVFLVRIAPDLAAALRRRSAFVIPLVAAAFLVVVSLTLDGVSRNVKALFSVTLPETVNLYLVGVEEAAELLIPVMLLLAIWQGLAGGRAADHREFAAQR